MSKQKKTKTLGILRRPFCHDLTAQNRVTSRNSFDVISLCSFNAIKLPKSKLVIQAAFTGQPSIFLIDKHITMQYRDFNVLNVNFTYLVLNF